MHLRQSGDTTPVAQTGGRLIVDGCSRHLACLIEEWKVHPVCVDTLILSRHRYATHCGCPLALQDVAPLPLLGQAPVDPEFATRTSTVREADELISPLRTRCHLEPVERIILGVMDDPSMRLTTYMTVDQTHKFVPPSSSVGRWKAEGAMIEFVIA